MPDILPTPSSPKEQYLNEIYINGLPEKSGISYSTTEIATKNKWIDGKIIYYRVVVGSLDATMNSSITILTLPTGVVPIINYLIIDSDGTIYSNTTNKLFFYVTSSNVLMYYNITESYRNRPYKLILRYTK